jgi:predicted MFS family arabinose efflux permease
MREFEVGPATAGWLGTIENGAFFATMFAVAGLLARSSRTRIALVAGLVGGIANIASGFSMGFEMLVATRVIAGSAFGVMAAAGTASAASSANPGRIFGVSSFIMGIALAGESFVIPLTFSELGFAGGYFLFAAICLPLMAAFGWLCSPNHAPGQHPSLRTAPNRRLAICAMAALFIYEIGQTGVYNFLGEVAEISGLSSEEFGFVQGWTAIAGLCTGGLVAIWLAGLSWRSWPVLVGFAANVAAVSAMAICNEETIFEILNLVRWCCYYFIVPVMMASIAKLDRLGRWAVTADASWNGGTFAGPVIAGWVIESSGYSGLAVMNTVVGVIGVVLMAFVLKGISGFSR